MTHPLYDDPVKVEAVTRWHLKQGNTVFQLFQFPGGEAAHSSRVLQLLNLSKNASVLSLGCGVGGMEYYWSYERPDLTFELVNLSEQQLQLTRCPGKLVCADAQGYVSPAGPFDCVVLAYMLGHVSPQRTITAAARNLKPGGVIVVLDVFDSSPAFDTMLCYSSPTFGGVVGPAHRSGLYLDKTVSSGFEPCEFATFALTPELLQQTTPTLLLIKS